MKIDFKVALVWVHASLSQTLIVDQKPQSCYYVWCCALTTESQYSSYQILFCKIKYNSFIAGLDIFSYPEY